MNGVKGKSNTKRTTTQFIEELAKVNPSVEVVGEYVSSHTGIDCVCRKCGYSWQPRPTNLLLGKGCPACAGRLKYTRDTFINAVQRVNPNVTILGEYTNSDKPIFVRCNLCGREWLPTGTSLLAGKACAVCSRKRGAQKRIESQEEFEENLKKINPYIEVLGKYQGKRKRIEVRCRRCGYQWNPIADNISRGKGCRRCAIEDNRRKRLFTENEFKERLYTVNRNIEVIGDYKSSQQRILVECKRCHYRWSPTANSLLQGTGCPSCSHTATSFMEQFLYVALKTALPDAVLSRDKKIIGRELDIVIPSRKYAMEIGSWYWHHDKIKKDLQKKALCEEKGIHLNIIYDSCPHEIEGITCYSFDLASEQDHKTLKKIVNDILLKYIDAGCAFDIDWEKIEQSAYEFSRRRSTEFFVREMKSINPEIEVLGEYTGYKNNVGCRCKKCGKTWNAKPDHLLHGTGCPYCAGRDKTPEEFERLFAECGNSDLILLGQYKNTQSRIHCKCKKCGYEWKMLPSHLLEGKGCGQCNGGTRKRVRCVETGEVFESMAEAAREVGVGPSKICNVCKGLRKTAAGYSWQYVETVNPENDYK